MGGIMKKDSRSVEVAFEAIDKGDYTLARDLLLSSLADCNTFNIHYGLALCSFQLAIPNADSEGVDFTLLEEAVKHAEEAAGFQENHFDVQFILGQSYALYFAATKDPDYQRKARDIYILTRSLASQRPDLPLESVIDALLSELDTLVSELGGESDGIGPIYH